MHLLITIGPLETFSESINTFIIPITTFRNIIQVFEPVGMMRVVVDEQDGLKKKINKTKQRKNKRKTEKHQLELSTQYGYGSDHMIVFSTHDSGGRQAGGAKRKHIIRVNV